uniref:Rapid ALkalinization Factor n=1 Tax=Opuntia streptacantha TaxID=393608 RepID=A0A7C8ZPN4_OPUST
MPTTKINLLPLPILMILLTHLRISNGYSDLGLNPLKSGEIGAMGTRVCDGTVGSCPANSEFEVGSEVDRRMLLGEQKKYISYETLKRDLVPCSVPGSSYYTCGDSPEANRYSRGCSIITRCARF